MSDENQWYTNKELFERLGGLKDELLELRSEMKETRALIKNYNGLREEIARLKTNNEVLKEQVNTIVNREAEQKNVMESVRNWAGWIFGLITLIVLLYNQIN